MRRILLATFLGFFALFSSVSSLLAQDPAFGNVWVPSADPPVSFGFDSGTPQTLILPSHRRGSFTITAVGDANTNIANRPNERYNGSFLSRTRASVTGNHVSQAFDYGVHLGATPQTTQIVYNLIPKSTSSGRDGIINVVQFARTSLLASGEISGDGRPRLNLGNRVIRLHGEAGRFTIKLTPGAEGGAVNRRGFSGFLRQRNKVIDPSDNSNQLTFAYDENPSTEEAREMTYNYRIALKNYLEADGTTPRTWDVTFRVIQAAAPTPARVEAVPFPTDLDLLALRPFSSALLFDVQIFRRAEAFPDRFLRWNAQIVGANPGGFLTLIPTTAGTFQTIQYSANATGAPREATVRFSSLVDGTLLSTDVQVRQLSTDIVVTTDPSLSRPLSPDAGSVDITYTYGGSAIRASGAITEALLSLRQVFLLLVPRIRKRLRRLLRLLPMVRIQSVKGRFNLLRPMG